MTEREHRSATKPVCGNAGSRSIFPGSILAAILVALFIPPAPAAAATNGEPRRVLILDSFGRGAAPFSAGIAALRTTLAKEYGEPVDIYDESMEMARFADSQKESALADFLEHRFLGRRLDVVLPVGAPAVTFAAKYRERLFPQTPIVFAGAELRRLQPGFFTTNTTLVSLDVNVPAVVDDILKLLPATTNIVMIFGSSPLERFWVREFHPIWIR